MACSHFQEGMLFRRIFSHAVVLFFSVFSSLAHLDGAFWGIVFFPLFLAIRFSGNNSLREWRRLLAPRGSGRRLFHYSGPLPAGNQSNGCIRPGMCGEWRGNGKLQKSVKIILVNTVRIHDAWHTPPAFCLSAEAFPFIVTHGPYPVPVVQWIERVSPKD